MKPQGYYNIASLILIIGLGLTSFFSIKGCMGRPASCPDITKRDTIRTQPADTSYHAFVTSPKMVAVHKAPVATIAKKGEVSPKPISAPSNTGDGSDLIIFEGGEVSPIVHADTTVYTDSIYHSAHFKAVINDLITGNKIVHREIQWADLQPETQITNTVSVVKKEYWFKVYLGGQIGGNAHKLDGGLGGLAVIKDWIAVQYIYRIGDQTHNVGAFIKLSFHKP